MEDITDPEQRRVDPKADRTVSLYGYVRGTHLKQGWLLVLSLFGVISRRDEGAHSWLW